MYYRGGFSSQRKATGNPRKTTEMIKRFGPPLGGWISNMIAPPPDNGVQGAIVLDNIFPTSTGCILRRGKAVWATLPDDEVVRNMFTYKNGPVSKIFASTDKAIYDITNNQAVVVYTGADVTNGNWSVTQMTTTGNVFLVGVNGVDAGWKYDGDTFTKLTVAFVGSNGDPLDPDLDIKDMNYVWVFKNRLWFIERNSLNSYYLTAADSVGGDAHVYPLGGIVTRGGSLVWGASWALGTGGGGGLSDQNVIITTEGEVAVFQGSTPEQTESWTPTGVYQIGRPLGRRSYFRGGGDIAVATNIGLIPLSKAISLDVTALAPSAVSYNIQTSWYEAVDTRGVEAGEGWNVILWPESKMAILSVPTLGGSYFPESFVSNTETGAWCRFTNWDMKHMTLSNGKLLFATDNNIVYQANIGGLDVDEVYSGVYAPLFTDLGDSSRAKVGKMVRSTIRGADGNSYSSYLNAAYNFTVPEVQFSQTVIDEGGSTSLWGTGSWGTAVWGDEPGKIYTSAWKSASGVGDYVTVVYVVRSSSAVPLDVEIVSLDITYTTAGMIT